MTAATITPTAIDAFVHIESVRVVDRHRRVLGDLRELADSIVDVGLLNPITLMRDGRLIAGQRRLEACRLLGWDSIPARFVDDLDDATKLLHAERDENTCRMDMAPSELIAIGQALENLHRPSAELRMKAGVPSNPEIAGSQGSRESRKTYTIVAKALGMSGPTYKRARKVVEVARDSTQSPTAQNVARRAIAEMDSSGQVLPAYRKVMAAVRASQDALDAKLAALETPPPAVSYDADEERPPLRGDRSPQAAERRRALIRTLAAQGHTSIQIGDRINILAGTVRRIARQHEIPIPADDALGRGTHKTIDSNRIVRETVQMLDGLDLGLNLVDFHELDLSEIPNWTASLSGSIRILNRLNKRLKEMVQ